MVTMKAIPQGRILAAVGLYDGEEAWGFLVYDDRPAGSTGVVYGGGRCWIGRIRQCFEAGESVRTSPEA